MKFIAIKTDDGTIKGKLAFYCRMLHVSRQGFYKYLSVKDRPWKYRKGQILRSTPNTAPLICGAYNTQPEGLLTTA